MLNRTLVLLLASPFATALAWAHEGHGMPTTSHWHAGDAALMLAAVAVGALVWLKSRK
jgi:hypothetical protein